MKKTVGNAVAFLLLLAVLLGSVSWLFLPKDNSPEAGIDDVLSSGYLAEPEQTLDVLILGDSLPKFDVIPPILWNQEGFPAYVCAAGGGTLPKVQEWAEGFFRRQTPKVVLLDTNVLTRDVQPHYEAQLGLERLLPVLRYHDNWKTVPFHQMARPVRYTYRTWEKGYYLCKLIEPARGVESYMEAEGENTRLSQQELDGLRELRTLCREHGGELILFSLPCAVNMNKTRHDTLTRLAEDLDVPYLDMNVEPVGLDWSVDSVDSGDHLNYWGAKKATRYLGAYLKQTGLLTDRRADPAYSRWDREYESFMEMARTAAGNTADMPEE